MTVYHGPQVGLELTSTGRCGFDLEIIPENVSTHVPITIDLVG